MNALGRPSRPIDILGYICLGIEGNPLIGDSTFKNRSISILVKNKSPYYFLVASSVPSLVHAQWYSARGEFDIGSPASIFLEPEGSMHTRSCLDREDLRESDKFAGRGDGAGKHVQPWDTGKETAECAVLDYQCPRTDYLGICPNQQCSACFFYSKRGGS